MSQLVAIFCDIDDFCKGFEPIYNQRLLHSGQRQRRRQSQLSLSEIMTIIVQFHASHYRDFKHYYTEYVAVHLRPYFPDLVSYNQQLPSWREQARPPTRVAFVRAHCRRVVLHSPGRWSAAGGVRAQRRRRSIGRVMDALRTRTRDVARRRRGRAALAAPGWGHNRAVLTSAPAAHSRLIAAAVTRAVACARAPACRGAVSTTDKTPMPSLIVRPASTDTTSR